MTTDLKIYRLKDTLIVYNLGTRQLCYFNIIIFSEQKFSNYLKPLFTGCLRILF